MGTDKKIRVIRVIRGQKSLHRFNVTLSPQTCARRRTELTDAEVGEAESGFVLSVWFDGLLTINGATRCGRQVENNSLKAHRFEDSLDLVNFLF